MNDLKVFNSKEFGGIRVLEKDGQPWFVGKDVADILGYQNTKDAILNHVAIEDREIIQRSQFTTLDIPNRGLSIINESGLYSLILSSKLPKAKEFKRWVTSEVLASIRQTGGYTKGNDMDFLIKTVVAQTTAAVMAQIPAIVSETVKSTLNLISADFENGDIPADKPKKRRISYHGKLDKLPIELRNEVISMIFEKNYTYMQVSDKLGEKGHNVHFSSLGRYMRRLADDVDNLPGIEIEN